MVRGEVLRLPTPKGARGHEQRGARYAVVVQADEFLALSTVMVSPTSTRARPATFRPEIEVDGVVIAPGSKIRAGDFRHEGGAHWGLAEGTIRRAIKQTGHQSHG